MGVKRLTGHMQRHDAGQVVYLHEPDLEGCKRLLILDHNSLIYHVLNEYADKLTPPERMALHYSASYTWLSRCLTDFCQKLQALDYQLIAVGAKSC